MQYRLLVHPKHVTPSSTFCSTTLGRATPGKGPIFSNCEHNSQPLEANNIHHIHPYLTVKVANHFAQRRMVLCWVACTMVFSTVVASHAQTADAGAWGL